MRHLAEVLVLCDYFLPARRAGGTVRALANLVDQLGDEFQFRILTRNQDVGGVPLEGAFDGKWRARGKTEVRYLTSEERSWRGLCRILRETRYDLLYLNSFFSPAFTVRPLILRRLGQMRGKPVILAPRGELGKEALRIRPSRKKAWKTFARAAGLLKDLLWHASTEADELDIRRSIPGARTFIAPDLVAGIPRRSMCRSPKEPGKLRIVVVARISPVKNVKEAIGHLQALGGEVSMDVFGPVESESYLEECRFEISRLPPNTRVVMRGPIAPDEVASVIERYDLFLLPTLGENFGHAIVEAMAAGCPVLISDRTPWRGLEARRAGWDVPPDAPGRYREILRRCVAMDAAEHGCWSKGALALASETAGSRAAAERHRALFDHAQRGESGASD